MWQIFKALLPIFILLLVAGIGLVLLRTLADRFPALRSILKAGAGDMTDRYAKVFQKAGHMVTPHEAAFFSALAEAVGDRYHIFSKVRLADIIEIQRGVTRETGQRAFNRIQSKHVDFVLCDKKSFEPLCAIEVDDSSHNLPHRRDRDEFLDTLFRATSFPLVRVPSRSRYEMEEVQAKVLEAVRL